MLNLAGEVIGITSYKIGSQGVEGMGYALNVNDVMPVVNQLVASRKIFRAWLGPTLTTVNPTVAGRYGLSVNKGAMVTDVPPKSPAGKAGLTRGDVIVGFDDTEINGVPDLTEAIHSSKIGQNVKITFWRGTSKLTTTATLIECPT